MTGVGMAKTALLTGIATFALIAGALLAGAPLVSADDPTPPAGQEEAAPRTGTGDGGTGRSAEDCPKHDGEGSGGSSSAGGVGFRGGPRGLRQ